MLAIIRALDEQIELLDPELRQLARSDRRLQALCAIFGVGSVLASHFLAEVGDVRPPLTVARKLARRAYHVLNDLEQVA